MVMTPIRTCLVTLTWLCIVDWPGVINFILQRGKLRHRQALQGTMLCTKWSICIVLEENQRAVMSPDFHFSLYCCSHYWESK